MQTLVDKMLSKVQQSTKAMINSNVSYCTSLQNDNGLIKVIGQVNQVFDYKGIHINGILVKPFCCSCDDPHDIAEVIAATQGLGEAFVRSMARQPLIFPTLLTNGRYWRFTERHFDEHATYILFDALDVFNEIHTVEGEGKQLVINETVVELICRMLMRMFMIMSKLVACIDKLMLERLDIQRMDTVWSEDVDTEFENKKRTHAGGTDEVIEAKRVRTELSDDGYDRLKSCSNLTVSNMHMHQIATLCERETPFAAPHRKDESGSTTSK
jgi:hypothetical protein